MTMQESYEPEKALAEQFALLMNTTMSDVKAKKIALELNKQHPTLQQAIFRTFLEYCRVLTLDNAWIDGRNQASADIAKKVMEITGGCTGLPYI